MSNFLKEFKRLSADPVVARLTEYNGDESPSSYVGGQADLTPLKNKAREAVEALNDAQKAADEGRAEDAQQAMQRAKAAIDAALGGQVAPGGGPGTTAFRSY